MKRKNEKNITEHVLLLDIEATLIFQIFLSNHTNQTYVSNQSVCCIELFDEQHN